MTYQHSCPTLSRRPSPTPQPSSASTRSPQAIAVARPPCAASTIAATISSARLLSCLRTPPSRCPPSPTANPFALLPLASPLGSPPTRSTCAALASSSTPFRSPSPPSRRYLVPVPGPNHPKPIARPPRSLAEQRPGLAPSSMAGTKTAASPRRPSRLNAGILRLRLRMTKTTAHHPLAQTAVSVGYVGVRRRR